MLSGDKRTWLRPLRSEDLLHEYHRVSGDRGDLRHRTIRKREALDSRPAHVVEVQVFKRRLPESLVPVRPILGPRSTERIDHDGDRRSLLFQCRIQRATPLASGAADGEET
jgi:hypothetical protein